MSLLPLLLLCSLGLLLPAGAQTSTATQELHVKLTESTSCPEPCHTLEEYVENTTRYFVSNTVFKFLPGTHNLNHPLNVSGVANISMVGINGTVNITCNYHSLSFAKISNLVLQDLTFSFYSELWFTDLIALNILRLVVQPDDFRTAALINPTNILGNSSLTGLCVISSFYTVVTSIRFKYNDDVSWALPAHNQLSITDLSQRSPYGHDVSMMIDLNLSQTNYSVNILLENLTTTIVGGLTVGLGDKSNTSSTVILTNFNLASFRFVLNYITLTEITVEDSFLETFEVLADYVEVHMHSAFSLFIISNVTISKACFTPNVDYIAHGRFFSSLVAIGGMRNLSFIDCKFLTNCVKGETASPAGVDSIVLLLNSEEIMFVNCEFSNNIGSPIASVDSTFILSGSNTFSNNQAYEGGALAFYGDSYVIFSNGSNTLFVNNTAETVGGAIYVDVIYFQCFFTFTCPVYSCFGSPPINLTFVNNDAENGGDIIFGALFDVCMVKKIHHVFCGGWTFVSNVFHINETIDSDFSSITSDPLRACLCENGRPSCTTVFSNLTTHPGEIFQLSAVVVGDRFGTVDGSVYAHFLPLSSGIAKLGNLEQTQGVGHLTCTPLSYTILSNSTSVTLVLTARNTSINQYPDTDNITKAINDYSRSGAIGYILRSTPIYINITLLPCPLGFIMSGEPSRCDCDTDLLNHGISCNLTTQTVHRSGTEWVNASFHGSTSNGVIVNLYCPNNYCRPEPVDVNLEYPGTQCAFNHSGILCGGCQSGLSLALGSSQCLTCSNDYLALLIPFALAGFALVFFIKLLNLTVAMGTLNGLIFYANIVRANQVAWISKGDTSILTVFIAWMNLDLGIETCFFEGLDAYWSTWLQFVFPLYIWAIVILIIILSHYFSTAARIFGSNSVPVLATLFLLSYPKLLRTIISIFQFSTLNYPDRTSATVWSFDGNIAYFSPKHIPLFLVAIGVVLLLWLPYTGILVFAQCLQRVSNYKVTRVVMKLKPFFDAYFGPLKDKHRYWVGLMLLLRGVLFISFGATPTSQSDIDILVTLAAVLCVFIYLAHIGGVYESNYLSLLENSFFLNLGLFAGGTLYIQPAGKRQSTLANTSVGIAFAQFLVIVAIHLILSLKKTRLGRKLYQAIIPQAVNRAEYAGLMNKPMTNREDPQQLMASCAEYRESVVLQYVDT